MDPVQFAPVLDKGMELHKQEKEAEGQLAFSAARFSAWLSGAYLVKEMPKKPEDLIKFKWENEPNGASLKELQGVDLHQLIKDTYGQ